MLDVDEQGAEVRRGADAGDFGADRAGEEAFDLAAARVGHQHLVVAEGAAGQLAAAHVGLDPQAPVRVEPQAVRAGQDARIVQRRAVWAAAVALRSGEQKDVPVEALAGVVATVFAPADDVPVGVGRTRVGRIGNAARAVVGEGEVDLAVVRVDRAPLGAVHLGGTDDVGRQAGIDQHFALVGEARPGRGAGGLEGLVLEVQGQPVARAVGVETGHVEGAFVEQATGLAQQRQVLATADVLVDVFVLRVVAGVAHQGAAGLHRGEDQALVGKAAKGAVLDRGGIRVEGVDLDDPAEVVGFVAVVTAGIGGLAGGIEALEFVAGQGIPAEAAAAAQAIALEFARQVGVARGEVAGPVLLAGQVGAPGRVAVGAVVLRATGGGAVGAVQGLEQGMAARRADHLHRRGGGDAAVVAAGHHLPVAEAVAADLDDGHAVGVDFLAHFLGRGAQAVQCGRSVGVQQRRVDVLVVEHQQAVVGAAPATVTAVDGEEVHAVMVHADLFGLVLGAVAGVLEEGREASADRRAPGHEDAGAVAGRHRDAVGAAHRHGVEGQAIALAQRHGGALFGRLDRLWQHAEEAQRAEGGTAGEDLPAALVDQLAHVRVGAVVAGEFIAAAKQHGVLFIKAHRSVPFCGGVATEP